MSNSDQDWSGALERTHEAVRNFARNEFNAYTRKIIHKMRRFPAVGIYGDRGLKTLWDEYCHERHIGPSDPQLVMAWSETLRPYYDEILKAIPDTNAVLLSIYSVWELEGQQDICGSIWPDGISEVLEKTLIREAIMHNDRRQL